MSIEQEIEPRLVAGRYQLSERLGGGGMGDVFAATDQRLLRPVAIKLLRPNVARDRDTRLRFELEARAAARLSHPNIVAVFDSDEDDGSPFLVMERLPGRTFAQEIADGPVGTERAVEVMQSVLSALAVAHSAGIVHRDVKPSNVLLTNSGMAKVTDFGIAQMTRPTDDQDAETEQVVTTGPGVVLATPAYVAPERLSGGPATPQSDLYSVGVMLSEALTAARATPGVCPPLPPSFPQGLRDVVVRATMPDPTRRFASAEEMSAALAAACAPPSNPRPTGHGDGDRTVGMNPDTNVLPFSPRPHSVPPRRGRARRRGLFALAAALVVAAAIVIGVLVAGGGDDQPTFQSPAASVPASTAAPAQPSTSLPAALDHAIDDLEDSVSR